MSWPNKVTIVKNNVQVKIIFLVKSSVIYALSIYIGAILKYEPLLHYILTLTEL